MSGRLNDAKKEMEELLIDSSNTLTGKSRLALMSELSDMESSLGNYQSAYILMKRYKDLNDSVNAQNYKEQLADLETRYRTAEKEQAILVLESKNRVRNLLLGGGAMLVLILSLWIWNAWNSRKKRTEKDMLLLKQQREIEVSKALMDGEEQERKRLAQELHDGLVGTVTGIKINVERLARDIENEELHPVIEQLDKTITELRHTARNLAPASLLRVGLEAAITDFCRSVQSQKTTIHHFLKGLNNISDKNVQTSVFRIVQELITNAVRHADAREIILQCTFENNLLLIEAEDNGKGFDVNKTIRNMGLNNIESRVKFLGGNIRLESQPGKGTHISIECNLPNL